MSEKDKHKRLTEVFENAQRITFNNDDRLVFFSDLHRGNNSWADEFARHQIIYSYALQHYYDAGYTYFEVGDGDELMKFKDIRLIREAHADVYSLMRKFHRAGRFYHLFGNHDSDYSNQELVANKLNCYYADDGKTEILFENFKSHEGLVLTHEESGTELFVAHGHQGEFLNDRALGLNRWFLRNFWHPLQLLGLQNPISVSKNANARYKVQLQLMSWVVANNQLLICGHTHQEYFPNSENDELPYFNIGSGVHPRWITCIEIKKGKIALVRWRIKPRKKGSLYVKRKIVAGPEDLANYG